MKRSGRNKTSSDAIVVDPQFYDAWIKYVFDRPVTNPQWYFSYWQDKPIEEFKATPTELVALLHQTFLRSGTDLTIYNAGQVNDGLNYIFSNSASNIIYALIEADVPEELRIYATAQIKHLYRDCFAKRCTNTLSHLNETGSSALNAICYMLWDISPLGSGKTVVFDVMEDALYIPHNACIESGLHGLGHRAHHDRAKVEAIIDRFLLRTPHLNPALKRYALAARTGRVQ